MSRSSLPSETIDCPRAKTCMTPCIARDGHTALSDGYYDATGWVAPVCVGCGDEPRRLLHELAERHQPARRYMQTRDAKACADRLAQQVKDYVDA